MPFLQLTRTYRVTVGADGTATATIAPDGAYPWSVAQISVELAAAPAGATCSIRKNGVLVSPIIPTGDTAAGEPPVVLMFGDELTVTWAGCTPGQVGTVLVIYDQIGR